MKIKNYLSAILITGLFLTPVMVLEGSSTAQTRADICRGSRLSFDQNSPACATQPGEESPTNSINRLIANIVNILSIIVGIIAVIMIIIGGFKYITSSGDSANISSAKNTVLYALVGLVIVALAQIIVRFVLSKTPSG